MPAGDHEFADQPPGPVERQSAEWIPVEHSNVHSVGFYHWGENDTTGCWNRYGPCVTRWICNGRSRWPTPRSASRSRWASCCSTNCWSVRSRRSTSCENRRNYGWTRSLHSLTTVLNGAEKVTAIPTATGLYRNYYNSLSNLCRLSDAGQNDGGMPLIRKLNDASEVSSTNGSGYKLQEVLALMVGR